MALFVLVAEVAALAVRAAIQAHLHQDRYTNIHSVLKLFGDSLCIIKPLVGGITITTVLPIQRLHLLVMTEQSIQGVLT